jgi:folate-binding Fe-S cluster repair protein YgfZ
VAVLHLLPHSSGVLAILPREIALPTLERMAKFVLRAKVKIEDLSDQYSVAGALRCVRSRPRELCRRPGPPTWSATESPSRAWPMAQSATPRYWVVRPRER